MHVDPATLETLCRRATEAATRAYAPASGFPVGAAVLTTDGRVFSGCNVENASYGLSICAERNAVFHAVAEGARALAAVAIWTDCVEPGSPCGACRQVLAEFGPAALPVVLVGRTGKVFATTLGELLPRPFTFRDLEERKQP